MSAQNRPRFYWYNWRAEDPEDKKLFLRDIIENKNLEVTGGAIRGRYTTSGAIKQVLELQKNGKANAITTVQKDSLCVMVGVADNISGHDILKRIYDIKGKCPALTAGGGGNQEKKIAVTKDGDPNYYRRLTPLEYERLQTLPDNYTEGVSNTQRYKMLGNGWTVAVVEHLFKQLPRS